MKLKKLHKLTIACDGGAASGKTTGARLISKKYELEFLSSGLLYRFASYQLLKFNPKNRISFLKKIFKKINLKKLSRINLHTAKISEHTSMIAKEKKIRLILKLTQKQFSRKYDKCAIEGRDISYEILPKADIKFFFKCGLNTAAKRRFKELKKTNHKIKLKDVKKAIKIRNYRDKNRKNSPLIQPKDGIIVHSDKHKNIAGMIKFMSNIINKKIKEKYGS